MLLQVLVLIVLMICRFANDGHRKTWGSDDHDFLGQGTTVGYAIIVPAVLLTYLLGANLSILELFINFIGGILFIAIGALAISYYQHQRFKLNCWSALASALNSASAGAKEASMITRTQYSLCNIQCSLCNIQYSLWNLLLQPKQIVCWKLGRADRVPFNGNKDV